MLSVLIAIPFVLAIAALVISSNRWRPFILPVAGVIHFLGVLFAITEPSADISSAWLALDPLGLWTLLIISTLFCCSSFYAVGYLSHRGERSNRIFTACLLFFLGLATLTTCAQHLGLIWVAIEGTTLATAPLIFFKKTPQSIEATWKYLLICSVGIAFALLGTFFIAYAALYAECPVSLRFQDLLSHAPQLSHPWLRAAFIFLLVGYGTKMGLAPMHTWKPDAYGEAPGVVGGLLAGGVTSCAFLALARVYMICVSSGLSSYVAPTLRVAGLFSMAVAAIFVVAQHDFKRLLAYSSVEHMGILAVGLGLGGTALYFTLFHVMANALTKGVLFMSAGNIHRAYASKITRDVRGAARLLPISASLFLAGFFAITGSPPFAPFISEFNLFATACTQNYFVTSVLFLILLFIIFIGMGVTVLRVVFGRPPATPRTETYRDTVLTTLPIGVLLVIIILLGIYIPSPLRSILADAARFLAC